MSQPHEDQQDYLSRLALSTRKKLSETGSKKIASTRKKLSETGSHDVVTYHTFKDANNRQSDTRLVQYSICNLLAT